MSRDSANCTSCGAPIPPGQGRSCSMCFGDIDHGRDGYYRQWAERQLEHEQPDEDPCGDFMSEADENGKLD